MGVVKRTHPASRDLDQAIKEHSRFGMRANPNWSRNKKAYRDARKLKRLYPTSSRPEAILKRRQAIASKKWTIGIMGSGKRTINLKTLEEFALRHGSTLDVILDIVEQELTEELTRAYYSLLAEEIARTCPVDQYAKAPIGLANAYDVYTKELIGTEKRPLITPPWINVPIDVPDDKGYERMVYSNRILNPRP